jgi:hypothetical protein
MNKIKQYLVKYNVHGSIGKDHITLMTKFFCSDNIENDWELLAFGHKDLIELVDITYLGEVDRD